MRAVQCWLSEITNERNALNNNHIFEIDCQVASSQVDPKLRA